MTPQEVKTTIYKLRSEYPDNIMLQTLDLNKFEELTTEEQAQVVRMIQTGIENPDSQVGAYAMKPTDYDRYRWVLAPIVHRYHGLPDDFRQIADWDLDGDYDLSVLDPSLRDISMRVRVARNTNEFPLPGSMTRDDRVAFEMRMAEAFDQLIANRTFGGRYYSLTPGSPYQITEDQYNELVAAHKMFKDMSGDPYLTSAGISRDWPYGRGMYESQNGQMIVWVNEEDQLRIVSMATGSNLAVVFENLKQLLAVIQESGLSFAVSDVYGNVTSCPSNLGTGMRASVHVALPNLVQQEAEMKKIAKSFGLSVRGAGGEHTGYGEGGIVDISPRARLGITEAEILRSLYQGIAKMIESDRSVVAV